MIMNFKDAYKSMTNEIHGDRSILNSILNGEQKKKKGFLTFFSQGRTLVSVAACFLIITTIFISYNKLEHSQDTEQNPANVIMSDEANFSKSRTLTENSLPDFSLTNSEYYGDVLNRIFSLTTDKLCTALGEEERKDPLNIFIEYPSKDVTSTITISRNTDLSSIVPDASYATIDGIYIAVSSQSDAAKQNILDDILK